MAVGDSSVRQRIYIDLFDRQRLLLVVVIIVYELWFEF